jgi:DNA-binding CsgD family transcriptional regulator
MNTTVSKALRDYIDSLSDSATCKDEHCVFQYINAAYGNLIGLQQPLDLIGGTAFDLPCGAAASAEAFQEQDRQVMNFGKEHKILDIHPFAEGEMHVFVSRKKPWFDENKKIVGTLLQSSDITDAYTMGISVTQRESEVLFLILRGKTSKLIALALGLSYRTVEGYLEKIRLKFGARNRTELFDIAMERGYMSQIPLSLFSKQLSIVLACE